MLVAAIDDTYADGGDLQAFADRAQRVYLIQGPLYVFGGEDPQADRAIEPPIMLPGETPGAEVVPDAPSVFAIEANQVDTLNVYNDDSISDDVGNLTATRLTGLGMGPDQFVAGRVLQRRHHLRRASRRSTSTSATATTRSRSRRRTSARTRVTGGNPFDGGRSTTRSTSARSTATRRSRAWTATTACSSAPRPDWPAPGRSTSSPRC